ncbi:MAG: glucosamine-6-phosphate deaminase [Paludibacter sp.]|nr:glucosamine-6-phosphate deaminase [Paludibacter sp.]MDD4199353.1 glucosamine-6-phosphate deaminase [Paludibacter sp.]MDD4427804.1 glucosamine-6-phosphate deaminase [Paludibacter sp.]
MTTLVTEKLTVKILPTRKEMGQKAAVEVAEKICELLAVKEELNMIFAAAPSQQEFMDHLIQDKTIEWQKINAFHMDEYIGLDRNDPQAFGNFLRERLFDKVPFKNVYYINPQAQYVEAECERYTKLLIEHPVDVVCLGIGENGHIAFNDPHIADFNDPAWVKVVKLDLVCRQQQVNEKCFEILESVPTHAITLTIPTLLKAKYMFCVVPARNKANAVYKALTDTVSEALPATILRTKENAILYLDNESSFMINGKINHMSHINKT